MFKHLNNLHGINMIKIKAGSAFVLFYVIKFVMNFKSDQIHFNFYSTFKNRHINEKCPVI